MTARDVRRAVSEPIALPPAPPFDIERAVRLAMRAFSLSAAKRIEAPAGTEIASGYAVTFDSVSWSGQNPIPMSSLIDADVTVDELIDGNELSRDLLGLTTSSEARLGSVLPTLYPVAEFRGQRVTRQIRIKAVFTLEPNEAATYPSVDELVAGALVQRQLAHEARASDFIIQTLAKRLGVTVTPQVTAAHQRALWSELDAPKLGAFGLGQAGLRAAELGWMSSSGIRSWVEERLIAQRLLQILLEEGVLDARAADATAFRLLESGNLTPADLSKTNPAQLGAVMAQAVLLALRTQLTRLPCVTAKN